MRERPRQRAKFSYFRGPLLMLFNTTRAQDRRTSPSTGASIAWTARTFSVLFNTTRTQPYAAITSANPPRGTIGGSDAGS